MTTLTDTTDIHDSADLFAPPADEKPTGRDSATLPTSHFRQLLDTAGGAVATHSHLPELMSVRLTAGDGRLTARATDLSWGVEAAVPADVVGFFDVCIPAKRLLGMAASFVPATSTKLALNGTEMVVTCDRSVSRFKTISPEDFPKFPDQATPLLACAADRLALAGRLVPWAANDVVGDRLTAVKLTVEGEVVRFQATDRYVAIVWDGLDDGNDDSPLEIAGETELLVHPKSLAELGRIAGRATGERVLLGTTGEPSNPGHLVVSYQQKAMSVTIAARCLEGADKYPALKPLLDHHREQGEQMDSRVALVVGAGALEASLRRVLHFGDDDKGATGSTVRWTVTDGTLMIECRTQEGEDSKDEISVATEGPGVADGKAALVRYGSDILRNAIKAVGTDDTLTVTVPAANAPTQFTSSAHPNLHGLVMALESK